MADVGFDRTDDAMLACWAAFAEDFSECAGLDRIADWGAGAVRFHVADTRRRHAGLGVGDAQHLGLRVLAGHGHGRGVAVLVDDGRTDDCVDAVAIFLCLC